MTELGYSEAVDHEQPLTRWFFGHLYFVLDLDFEFQFQQGFRSHQSREFTHQSVMFGLVYTSLWFSMYGVVS